MALIATLVDNFNDNTIGPQWGNYYGGVSETGGRARVPCTTGFAGYQSGYAWTFAGSSVYLQLPTIPAASTATEAYCGFTVNSSTAGTRLGFIVDVVAGELRCVSEVDYFDAGSTDIAYSGTDHLWLRLADDGTNVIWQTSLNGSTWTTRRTLARPAWVGTDVDACALDLFAHRDAGTADFAEYDFVNTTNDGAVVDAAAALTAQTSLTAAARVAAKTGAGLTADGTLSVNLVLSARVSAALTAESSLTADAANDDVPEEVAGLAAGELDLLIEQGATFVQTYTVSDPDGFTWDGWTARAQIRSAPADSGDLLLDLTPYLTVTGPDIRLVLPATTTQTLTRNGMWDLETAKGSTVVRILQGKVVVSLEVTR